MSGQKKPLAFLFNKLAKNKDEQFEIATLSAILIAKKSK
jgi:hypothetical protein